MPLDAQVRRLIRDALRPPAALGEAQLLWRRVLKLCALNLVTEPIDREALELACYALHLSSADGGFPDATDPTPRLRDQLEQAALALVETLAGHAEPALLDRTARLLHETVHREPLVEEAKLLGDALRLGDFGMIGLIAQASRPGQNVPIAHELVERWNSRQAYGYWRARLNADFHFPAVRAMARRRYEHARRAVLMLEEELNEDLPPPTS